MQLGLAAALLSGVAIASSSIVLRRISKDVHFTVLSFWFSLICVTFSGTFLLATDGFNMPCRVRYVSLVSSSKKYFRTHLRKNDLLGAIKETPENLRRRKEILSPT